MKENTFYQQHKKSMERRDRWRKISEETEKERNESWSEWYTKKYPNRVKWLNIIFWFLILIIIIVSLMKI